MERLEKKQGLSLFWAWSLLIIELKDAQEQWKGRERALSHRCFTASLTEVKTKPYTEVEEKTPDSMTYLCVS